MVIWILNGPMNLGGTESLIMELLRNKDKNVDVKLVIHSSTDNNHGVYDEEIKELGIPRYDLPSVGSVGVKKYKKAFKNLIEEIGMPDVIHSNMNAVGGIICKVAKRCGIKHRIVHCHAEIKYKGSRLSVLKNELALWVMKKYVNKYANHFWACSKAAAKRLFYKSKKTVIIPNVINVGKYFCSEATRNIERQTLNILSDVLAVGAVGRIASIKNYETIIKAISILKKEGTNAHFYCYGGIVDEQYYNLLLDLIKQQEVEDRIHFLGVSTNINEKLKAFDVYVMPSISEGLGISALEAQASGLPVLLSKGVPAETDMGIGTVKRIETNIAKEWAAAIKDSKIKDLSEETILSAFVKKGYDSKTKCKEIYKLYKDMVG